MGTCRAPRSGLPMPAAGRSLRASCPALARCFLRFAILAPRRKQRRLPGTGSPSQPTFRSGCRFSTCTKTSTSA